MAIARKTGTSYTPKMVAVTRVFEFRCSNAIKDKVVRTVASNFTWEEIEMMKVQGKPIVWSGGLPDGKRGHNARVDTRRPHNSPEFRFSEKAGEDTITHEIIHHLRTVDVERSRYSKTAYPVKKNGVCRTDLLDKEVKEKEMKNAEETATVSEVEIRTKEPSKNVSNYWRVDENTATGKDIRDADRLTLRKTNCGPVPNGSNVIGKDAVKMLNRNYPKTMISFRRTKERKIPAIYSFNRIINLRRKKKWRRCRTNAGSTAPTTYWRMMSRTCTPMRCRYGSSSANYIFPYGRPASSRISPEEWQARSSSSRSTSASAPERKECSKSSAWHWRTRRIEPEWKGSALRTPR